MGAARPFFIIPKYELVMLIEYTVQPNR